MKYFNHNKSLIHPEDQNDVAYFTKKWGVTVRQINDAILETGSVRAPDIREALVRNGSLLTLSSLWHKFFKTSTALI